VSRRLPEAAPRVRRSQIERFYRSCGEGLLDEEAIEDVGVSLYARCQSMLGKLICPDCGAHLERLSRSLRCNGCSWNCTWSEFRQTTSGKHLSPGRMGRFVADYVQQYAAAGTLSQKIILIDTLIHRFHGELVNGHTPGAYNLIEGDLADMAAFLDRINYGENMPEDIRKRRESWRQRLRRAPGFWSTQLDAEHD
jgi:hypothetical protein